MSLVVLTIDQRDSRAGADRVPALMSTLNDAALGRLLRRFERTAGDEVQGVLDGSEPVLARLETLIRDGGWNIGLGVGPVEEPLPRSTRAGRGEAFLAARQAVNRSKQTPARLSVVGTDEYHSEHLETVLWLWAGVLSRRSARGWEVVDLIESGSSYTEAATALGISQSAVSQRAAAAGVVEGARARMLAGHMLDDLLSEKK